MLASELSIENQQPAIENQQPAIKNRHPEVLTQIYEEHNVISIWERALHNKIALYAQALLEKSHKTEIRLIEKPSNLHHQLEKALPLLKHRSAFIDDVALVTDMFACLFELDQVGLRLAVLDKAMCPKFHVDRVPCRLVSTYAGAGTQWFSNEHINRDANGKITPQHPRTFEQLQAGDVALLKGESWEGNEGRGLVHRSPPASQTSKRLILTLDFA